MTICDICEDKTKSTKRVSIKFDMPDFKDNYNLNLDVCSNCINYVRKDLLTLLRKVHRDNLENH